MVFKIFGRVFKVLAKKPFKLWGLSMLAILFEALAYVAFLALPGVWFSLILLLEVGMTMVFLRGYRGEEIHTLQIFSVFQDKETFKRVLVGMLWMWLWVFVWGIIPVVGPVFAIIRSYQYRLTPYILVNEPDVKPTEAINVSRERTKGYVGKMFLADILPGVAVFLVALTLSLLGLIPYVGIVFYIILVLAMLVVAAFGSLFMGLVKASFYEEITHPTMNASGVVVKTCPQCGASVEENALFCSKCGYRFPEPAPAAPAPAEAAPAAAPAEPQPAPAAPAPAKAFCPQCGKEVAPDALFCPECGAKLK